MLADFKKNSKYSFWKTIRVAKGLDPDLERRSVSPDQGQNC